MKSLFSVKKFEGVFYRVSKKRFHNGRPDRSYTICYSQAGKKMWLSLGWASLGVTAEDAYSTRMDILRRLKRGQVPKKPRFDFTVTQAFEHYLAWLAAEKKHTATPVSNFNHWIKPHCGEVPLNLLDHSVLDALKIKVSATMSAATIHLLFSTFRAAINHCITRRLWQGINPLSRVGGMAVPPTGTKCERFLTPEEARILLAELAKTSPMWHDMALVSLHTGLRLTELFRIQGQDINEECQVCTLTAKGGERENVTLTPESLEALLRHRREPHELVFRREDDAALRQSRGHFSRAVETCGFNNGITGNRHKVWFHTLRHTFASWLAQDGVDIYAIMKLMRHKKIEMTQRYAHLIPEQQRKHLNIIRRRFSTDGRTS